MDGDIEWCSSQRYNLHKYMWQINFCPELNYSSLKDVSSVGAPYRCIKCVCDDDSRGAMSVLALAVVATGLRSVIFLLYN